MSEVMVNLFGEFLRAKMTEKRLTLRQLAQRSGFDPSNLSKLERGVSYPPQKIENLNRLAEALDLDDEERAEMIEAAEFGNGKIPQHFEAVKSNQSIPLLLRAINNKKMDPEQVKGLAELIESENEWQGRIID